MTNAAGRLALSLLCLVPAAWAGEAALTGRQVMEKARRVNEPKDETVEAEMRLIAKGGRVTRRRVRIEYLRGADGLDRMLIRFSYPRRMKGTGLLTLERARGNDDQWLYLVNARRVRRILTDARTERFVQSDFTYEDLQPEDLDDNTYKLLRTDDADGRRCHIVEAIPKNPGGHARREIAVDAERWLPLSTRYYDAHGKLLKTQTAGRIARHGPYWRPSLATVRDHRTGHASELDVSARTIDAGVDPDHFTQRFLQSGR